MAAHTIQLIYRKEEHEKLEGQLPHDCSSILHKTHQEKGG